MPHVRTCQAVGCAMPVDQGRFMCRPHWFGLPRLLRKQINDTWADRRRHAGEGVTASAPYILAHVEACDEARRWTADAEGRLADYVPDADRLKRLQALDKKWWWSRDDERFYGPCHDRGEAIMDAWADDPERGAFVCRAAAGRWQTNIFDADALAERFDDANADNADPDEDQPSECLKPEDWLSLAERCNALISLAIARSGSTAWLFEGQEPSEWVDIPTMWAAAQREAALAPEGRSDG